ncbi:major facilitator superfamily MFS_1 [Pseudonocardia dioxanivorans CB1190]|uniref:Major facilitator superfamily MFS_1 n=1 Tax=Pseudonocardia dioxanivorans (strain ATCC 55486 / DSM 44775 / JCM 13855 / CB1190) TaxID=675635 RepID=F4CJS0_PSEUX|nr:MFS transporter [Pseudonocardia dioxanivorans]AEA25930.1 major facilitator superfamily MFS_1 [Pseudonocardia dioxanivorans CB1190]
MSLLRTPEAGPGVVSGLARPVYLRRILVFAFLGTLFDGAELNLVGYPMAYIAETLHVSTIQIVQISTLQGFASIVGGLVCGWLGDRIGRRWTYTASVLIFGIAAILGGLAPTYLTFMLTRILAGVGMGGLFGLAFSMFAESWKTARRGAMGGSIQAMYFTGEILTEGVVYWCTLQFGLHDGWRAGYVVIGVVTLVIGGLAALLLPESEQWLAYRRELAAGRVPEGMRAAKVPLVDLFRGGYAAGTVLFIVLASAMFLTTNSMIAYLTTFLVSVQKLPLGTASLIVLFGLVVTAVSYPATGWLSDVIRRKWAFFVSCLVGIVGFGWFLTLVATGHAHIGHDYWASPAFWALMLCAGGSGGFGVLGVWMAEFFPTRIRSSGSNTGYYAGRGIGAGLFPLVALGIAGSVPMALALGVVGPVVGAVVSLFAPDRTGREIQAVE